MRVLFVTPVEIGSGETITALHMAERLVAHGDQVLFLASAFARRFVERQFPDAIRDFTDDGARNRAVWDAAVREFQPDAVIFADYPLLFFASGAARLANRDEWERSLEMVDAALFTLDHLGFAQRAIGLFFGPAHLSFHYEAIPAIPERMRILLPCPMHEPGPVAGRRGLPFRCWDVPLTLPEERRAAVRRQYLERDDDYLIFHAVPTWAWRTAEMYGLPYYQFLPEILEYYLADLPRPVTVVSVNKGDLLKQPANPNVRIVNIPTLPKDEYEGLLFASDLMITENKMAVTLGKAICGMLPCAVLRNSYRFRELMRRLEGRLREQVKAMEMLRPGAVYRYTSLVNGMEEIDRLGLYRENSITGAFAELEVYGDAETRQAFERLLTDEATRAALRAAQAAYIARVRRLGDVTEVLRDRVTR